MKEVADVTIRNWCEKLVITVHLFEVHYDEFDYIRAWFEATLYVRLYMGHPDDPELLLNCSEMGVYMFTLSKPFIEISSDRKAS